MDLLEKPKKTTFRLLDELERYIYSNLIRPPDSPFSKVLITHEGLELVPSQEGRSPSLRDRALIENWISKRNLPAEIRWRKGNILIKVRPQLRSATSVKSIYALQEDLTQAFARMSLPTSGKQSALVNLEDNEVMDLDVMFALFQDGRIFLEGKEGEGPDFNLSIFESNGPILFDATLTVGGKKVASFGADDARGILGVVVPVLQKVSSRYAWVSEDDQREIFRKLRSHLITLQSLKGYPFGKVVETMKGYEVQLTAPLRPQQMTHLRRWAHQFGLHADFSVKGETLHIRPTRTAKVRDRQDRRAALLPHSALSQWVAQLKKNRAFMLGSVVMHSPEEYELTFKVSGGEHTVLVSLGVNSGRTILIYNPDDGPAQRFVLQGRSPKEIPDLLNAALKESHASWRLEGGF